MSDAMSQEPDLRQPYIPEWLREMLDEAPEDQRSFMTLCLRLADKVYAEFDQDGAAEWIVFAFEEGWIKGMVTEYQWNVDDLWDGEPPYLVVVDKLVAALGGLAAIKGVGR